MTDGPAKPRDGNVDRAMKFAKATVLQLLAIVVPTIIATALLPGCLKLVDNYLLSHCRSG